MPEWYHTGLPRTATPEELFAKWASDNGLTPEQMMWLTKKDRSSAYEALRSLAYWWDTPMESDRSNPFWMEDEGYDDSDKDTRLLNELAATLRSRCEKETSHDQSRSTNTLTKLLSEELRNPIH